jgi:NTP pyrophosphatase (non-canonical NTP hydrolase)
VRRPLHALSAALLALVATAACGGGTSADEKAFCERLDRLADNDPFRTFGDRATDREIQQGFRALVERADELAEVAPEEARSAADAYAEAADALDDVMAAAGYHGDDVDARAYREHQVDYAAAAARLERYLDGECG